MAIPQEEYIHIISKNVGDRSSAQRDLSGLVFTTTASLVQGADEKWNSDYDKVTVYSQADAARLFGSTSKESEFAGLYFAYISPSATAARSLTFCRIGADVEMKEAISKVDEQDSNFGSCAFLQSGEHTVKDLTDAIGVIKGLNYKYLLSVAIGSQAEDSDSSESSPGDIQPSALLNSVTAAEFAKYCDQNGVDGNGFFLIKSAEGADDSDDGALDAFMPMAIFAATDYNAVNSTTNFMFKQFDGVKPAVSTLSEKKSLDKYNVNYVGLVQNYGTQRQFLQQGVNLDGEDTAVFCNEIWLKSRISAELFDMMLTQEKIPANQDGEDLIYNAICVCAEQGKVNGTIEPLKTLTDAQRRTIFTLTNDANAWETVYNNGYWLNVEIRQVTVDKRTEYWAYYTLIYSKGDSIRKVEGRDFLV